MATYNQKKAVRDTDNYVLTGNEIIGFTSDPFNTTGGIAKDYAGTISEISGLVKVPADVAVSQYYRFWAKCDEGLNSSSTIAADSAIQKNPGHIAFPGIVLAADPPNNAWDIADRIHGVDGVNAALRYDNANINYNSATNETLMINIRHTPNATTITNAYNMFGNASAYPGSSYGISNLTAITGEMSLQISDGTTGISGDGGIKMGTTTPGAPEFMTTIFLDGSTMRLYLFNNGVLIEQDQQSTNQFYFDLGVAGINDFLIDGTVNFDFVIDSAREAVNNTDGVYRDLSILVIPSLPTNIQELATFMNDNLLFPLSDADIKL